MFSLIAFVLAAIAFFFVAIEETVGDLNLLGWGLFFLALGHVLSGFGPDRDFRR